MAKRQSEILTACCLERGQEGLAAGQEQVLTVLDWHSEVLRLMAERLGLMLEKLHPEEGDDGRFRRERQQSPACRRPTSGTTRRSVLTRRWAYPSHELPAAKTAAK